MTQLTEVWLQGNSFSGPLPDFSLNTMLQNFSVRDNQITGPVPQSLTNLASLRVVNLTNNLLQGPVPEFEPSVAVDMINGTNSFCLSDTGNCDPRVSTLLSVAQSVGYPGGSLGVGKGTILARSGWGSVVLPMETSLLSIFRK